MSFRHFKVKQDVNDIKYFENPEDHNSKLNPSLISS
jgi:hypothetical protein